MPAGMATTIPEGVLSNAILSRTCSQESADVFGFTLNRGVWWFGHLRRAEQDVEHAARGVVPTERARHLRGDAVPVGANGRRWPSRGQHAQCRWG